MVQGLTYQAVEDVLENVDSPYDASEAHGMICGYICCSNQSDTSEMSFQLIIGNGDNDEASVKEAEQQMLALYQLSLRQLTSMNFEFQLLLPSDDEDLRDRAKALGAWCHGFHTGQLMVKLKTEEVQDEELRDALYHISEISKLDYESLEISEDDERSFVEVMEYVRVAVLMVYSQVHEVVAQTKGLPPQDSKKILH